MKNTTELRQKLSNVFKDLENKKINTKEVRGYTSIAAIMVKSAIAEGNYNKFLGKKVTIPFLKTQSK